MRKAFLASFLVAGLFAAPALADGKIYVQIPDLSSYTGAKAEQFLKDLVMANVVSGNCAGYEVTEEEWSLLTDSADLIAYGTLKLDTNTYDADYYSPAFDALDDPETCATEGPKVQPILDILVEHGGSREALPDQDKAYEDWRAWQDQLQAGLDD